MAGSTRTNLLVSWVYDLSAGIAGENFMNEEQKTIALNWKSSLNDRLVDPVVTEIVSAPVFYEAEEYHQDFYAKNPDQGYCSYVIRPKLKKLKLE